MTPLRRLVLDNRGAPILDLGGGFGDNFLLLKKYLGNTPYTVVDGPNSCALGERLLRSRVTFLTDFPSEKPPGHFGLTIVIGTLQYILNSDDLIRNISRITGDTIFISRSPLRQSGKDFFSVQEITPAFEDKSAGKCPVIIRSIENLIADFEEFGFQLKEKNKIQDYSGNMQRLSTEFQDCGYYNLTFKKRSAA